MDALIKIIDIAKGQTALAILLKSIVPESKIQQAHISNWLNRDGYVPAEWVIPCCQAVNWQVTPHQLRTDLYPHPHDGLPDHLRVGEAA